MKSLIQFFQYMNDIEFPYVVMRNFEELPDLPEGHNDIDLLVYDFYHWKEVFPGIRETHNLPRIQHKLVIEDRIYYLDIRSIGDGYYPAAFQQKMLDSRVWDERGFYVPDRTHFAMGLVYHVVHHKNCNTYPNILGDLTVSELLEALKGSQMGYIACKDPTVGRFNEYWKGATSVVSKEDGNVVKTQTGWQEFDLIENELRSLKNVESIHFPKVKRDGDSLACEDCGDSLTIHNLPDDWKFQLVQILSDLKTYNIKHRDIKPDNLMVKDFVIKLIDFGWAERDGEGPVPPRCLGMPYRPTYGWDDNFSMKKVIKEIEYQLEEFKDENSRN